MQLCRVFLQRVRCSVVVMLEFNGEQYNKTTRKINLLRREENIYSPEALQNTTPTMGGL